MQLTKKEEAALSGEIGEGVRMAFSILYELGKLYGAKRFIPISQAHIDGCAYTTVWDAGTEFVEKLCENGARVSVPATLNITARDIPSWRKFKIPEELSEKSRRLENAYLRLGCIPTWSCAPYLFGNVPHFGQDVAWAESNAVNYVNSVIGARTNRYGDLVDICCAIAGLVPEFGLHMPENRAGQLLFKLNGFDENLFHDSSTYAVLGYLIGRISGDKIPVIEGLPKFATHDDLKALSAAAAASGAVAMFHAVGVTPEAPTLKAAFMGKFPEDIIDITPDILKEERRILTCADDDKAGLVVLGCPHASYMELEQVHKMLSGRHVKKGVEFWIQTSNSVRTLASRNGLLQALESLGVSILQDSCINNFDIKAWGFATIITNSAKMAHYAPGNTGVKVIFQNTTECVEAAVNGEVDRLA